MAPREKEEQVASHDSYGTMPDSGNAHGSGNVSTNVGMVPLGSPRIKGSLDDEDPRNNDPSTSFARIDHSTNFLPIEGAIEKVGTGAFQYKILLSTGLCFMADAMEVLLLTFLSTILKYEWNLSEQQVDSIVAVVFAGAMMGTLILGRAADYRGRKPVFAVTASLIAIAGVATALCRTYEELIVARFFVGFGVGGLTVPFDCLSEFLPGAARGKNLLYIEFFWTFGTLSVPTLAYLTLDTANGESHWQLFVILCSIPCFLSAILGLVLVPESPRWLLEQCHSNNGGGNDVNRMKALEILKSAAHSNGINQAEIDGELFPPNTVLVLSMNESEKLKSNGFQQTVNFVDENTNNETNTIFGSFGELFRSPKQMRITILLWATWFGFGFLYYGVIIAVSLIFTSNEAANDDYVTDDNEQNISSYDFDFGAIFVTASAEIFGLIAALFTIDSIGRIPSQTIAYLIGGISTFILGILCAYWNGNDNDDTFRRTSLIILAFISRMAMMASSCVTWVSTSEMLSTEIRSTGHGAANAMSRLGGFIAPFIITEGNSMGTIGSLVLLVSLLTAECANKLPETAGKPMGDVSVESSALPNQTHNLPLDNTSNEPSTSYQELI